MLVGEVVRIAPDGVRITTPDIDGERAVVEVATRVENDSIAIRTVDVVTEIRDADGSVVASDVSKATVLPGEPATVRQRLYVHALLLWSPKTPALYGAAVALTDAEAAVDAERVTFGIRSLGLDPEHGLRINGETVKLRGACVHHDKRRTGGGEPQPTAAHRTGRGLPQPAPDHQRRRTELACSISYREQHSRDSPDKGRNHCRTAKKTIFWNGLAKKNARHGPEHRRPLSVEGGRARNQQSPSVAGVASEITTPKTRRCAARARVRARRRAASSVRISGSTQRRASSHVSSRGRPGVARASRRRAYPSSGSRSGVSTRPSA